MFGVIKSPMISSLTRVGRRDERKLLDNMYTVHNINPLYRIPHSVQDQTTAHADNS